MSAMAGKAAGLGAAVALATVNPQSTIAAAADIVVAIPAAAKESSGGAVTAQPMGSLFEQSLLLLLDALILELMREEGTDAAAMLGRHANLE